MLEECGETRHRKIGVVDLFAGCGGASLGFKAAARRYPEVSILGGVDVDPYSCTSYERNVGAPCIEADLADVLASREKFNGIRDALRLDAVDDLVVIGCSPCQGFAAHRASHDTVDDRRSLFTALCELIVKLSPRALFLENVPDLISRRHWRWFTAGMDMLTAAGYYTHTEIHNFAELGLPQERFRVTIVGTKFSPIIMKMKKLAPSHYKTVRQAIGHLPRLQSGEACALDVMHQASKHRPSTISILESVPKDGGNRPIGVGPRCLDRAREKHGGYTDVYGRLAWDRPAVTITARCRTPSCGRFGHPEDNRGLTPREAANLQGFPDDVVLHGPWDDLFKQIGNAVPPLIAEQFAEQLFEHVTTARSHGPSQGRQTGILRPIGPGFAVRINGLKIQRQRQQQFST